MIGHALPNYCLVVKHQKNSPTQANREQGRKKGRADRKTAAQVKRGGGLTVKSVPPPDVSP